MKKIIYLFITAILILSFQSSFCQLDPMSPEYADWKLSQIQNQTGNEDLKSAQVNTPLVIANANNAGVEDLLIPLDGTFTQSMPRNDDLSSAEISLPFSFEFYGTSQTSLFINNNGNVSFGTPFFNFTSTGFPVSGFPMIAPFWADVDTRNESSGVVWHKIEPTRITIIWENVGYFAGMADKLNTFELILTDGSDPLIGIGNNVAFSYANMQWTTGGASGGIDGFGGTPATIGINKGDGIEFALVGRYDHLGDDYDGPGGESDGISSLSDQMMTFSTGSFANVPPIAVDLPSSIVINPGETWEHTISFISPEAGQTTTTVVDIPAELSLANAVSTPGNVSTVDLTITGLCEEIGTYTITFTSTDDGDPVGTTVNTLEVRVEDTEAPSILTQTELIVNGNFETGDFTGWNLENTGSALGWNLNDGTYIPAGPVGTNIPIDGAYDIVSEQTGPGLNLATQPLIVPGGITHATLSWKDRIYNYGAYFSDPNQEFRVSIIDEELTETVLFSTDPGDDMEQPGPHLRSFDVTAILQSLEGKSIVVEFAEQDDLGFFNVYLDDVSLTISGLADITADNDPGVCGAVVDFPDPVGTDNCGATTIEQTAGLPSGSQFPVGITTNTFEVTDDAGNSASYSFTVTVNDIETPTALCQDADVYMEKSGTVTIEAEDIDAGSNDNCSFDLSVEPNLISCEDFGEVESVEKEVTLTITDASGNSDDCTSTVTIWRRPTTLTYTGEIVAQYSDVMNLSATLMDVTPDDGGPLEGMTITFEIGSQSVSAVTDAEGKANAILKLDQSTCDLEDWSVKATFAGACSYWKSSDEVDITYKPEIAAMEYTGTNISATVKTVSDEFVVTLRGIIMDADDGSAGDVSNAMARFVVGGTPVSDWLNIMLIDASDPTIGVIEFDWEDAINDNPTTYDVQIELFDCYYTGISAEYPLTIYNAAGDFITGGGHMIMTENADGLYPPTPESKLNFGFNVKFNKKGTNLQGKMNIIYRVFDANGELLNKYQIKSNATTSLGTNMDDENALIAEFVSKAELIIMDEYDNILSVVGNLTLHVTITDKGEPGDEDAIGFSLYNGDPSDPNALWFSSNWDEIKTMEQIIEGGNLVVHSGAAISFGEDGEADDVVEVPKGKGKNKSGIINDINYKVYPNPFSDRVRFEFVSPQDVNARIDVYDMTGRKVKTVFDAPVNGSIYYNAEFKPDVIISGMYIYRMTLGDAIYNGKLVYKKK